MEGNEPITPEGFTLTIDDALEILKEAGHPRDPSAVRRWCNRKKLECFSEDTPNGGLRWLLKPSALEERIRFLDELEHARKNPRRHTQAHTGTEGREGGADDVDTRIHELEDENLQLKISVAANKQILRDAKDRDQRHLEMIAKQGETIGQQGYVIEGLNLQLKQLGAGNLHPDTPAAEEEAGLFSEEEKKPTQSPQAGFQKPPPS